MGKMPYIIPRLVIGLIIQVLCCHSTLPLYAIVTQMGSSFKKAIFEEHVQHSLIGWANDVKKRKWQRSGGDASSEAGSVGLGDGSSSGAPPKEVEHGDPSSVHV